MAKVRVLNLPSGPGGTLHFHGRKLTPKVDQKLPQKINNKVLNSFIK